MSAQTRRTPSRKTCSAASVCVLTSVNYKKMSAEDKAKEPAATRRTDGDYALSYIQRVGNGRVFYEAHGHEENVYFSRPFVAHMLAGFSMHSAISKPMPARAKNRSSS